jgi:biotin operon repressor
MAVVLNISFADLEQAIQQMKAEGYTARKRSVHPREAYRLTRLEADGTSSTILIYQRTDGTLTCSRYDYDKLKEYIK